jgi:hypothetical protein
LNSINGGLPARRHGKCQSRLTPAVANEERAFWPRFIKDTFFTLVAKLRIDVFRTLDYTM